MTFASGLGSGGLGGGGLVIRTMRGLHSPKGNVPSPAHAPIKGVHGETVSREIAGCKEDFDEGEHNDTILRRFDTALLEYLLEEDSFFTNIEAVASQAKHLLDQIATRLSIFDDPKNITDRKDDLLVLVSLGSSWGALETNDPWQKLHYLTKWSARVATYQTIPSNKFTNVQYPEATLVQAPNGRGGLEYIPANRIDSARVRDIAGLAIPELIAAQYPFASGSAEMFLRVAYEKGGAIIDLTRDKAGDRAGDIEEKDIYHPKTKGEIKEYPTLSIRYLEEEADGTRLYEITDLASRETKTIKRVHFTRWPDGDALGDAERLTQLAGRIDAFGAPTVFVHCRGGVGRTGSLLAAYYTLHRIRAGLITARNLDKDVLDTVFHLRVERGPECVQTKEQYADLVAFARDALAKRSAGTV